MNGTIHAPDRAIHNAAIPDLQHELVEVWYGILTAARAWREDAARMMVDSTDTMHVCMNLAWVRDADVPTESNEHGERWCARCGERILVEADQ